MKLEILEYLPDTDSKVSPILFVHGAFHGAWCWKENFLPYFSSKGFPSYAVSLRGHGGSEGKEKLNSFSLDDYMEDVLEAIRLLGDNPVLIGHSMGGAVVQKIMYLHPDKIKAAVLLASVPPGGMLKDLLRLIFTNFRDFMSMRAFNRGKNVSFPSNLFLSGELEAGKKDGITRLLLVLPHI